MAKTETKVDTKAVAVAPKTDAPALPILVAPTEAAVLAALGGPQNQGGAQSSSLKI
jgi:hypothetical protein